MTVEITDDAGRTTTVSNVTAWEVTPSGHLKVSAGETTLVVSAGKWARCLIDGDST